MEMIAGIGIDVPSSIPSTRQCWKSNYECICLCNVSAGQTYLKEP